MKKSPPSCLTAAMTELTAHQAYRLAEEWAVVEFGMKPARENQSGHDGILPDGRKVEIKSKKHGAHSDSQTYVDLSESKFSGEHAADCLLVVFVDYETGKVVDHILRDMRHVLGVAKCRTVRRITISDLKSQTFADEAVSASGERPF